MLKRLTRKLFILSVLVAYLTLAVPSTPAQGSGYSLSGYVFYQSYAVSGPINIYKWNGSWWVFHGYAYASGTQCGAYYYDTGGPGRFMGEVTGMHAVMPFPTCGYGNYWYLDLSGSSYATELSPEHPSASMTIYTWSESEP